MTKPFLPIHNEVITSGMLATMSHSAFAVLAVLLMYADRESHRCWPSEATIASLIGQSRRSVIRHVKELESMGIVVVRKRAFEGGLQNEYEVRSVKDAAGSGKFKPQRVTAVSHGGGDSGVTPTPGHVTPATEARDTTVTRHVTVMSHKQEPRNKNHRREPKKKKTAKATTYDPLSAELPFGDETFRAEWSDYVQYRHEKGNPLSELATRKALAKLERMGRDDAIEAMANSVMSEWTGLFPPRAKADKPSETSSGNPEGEAYLDMSVDELNRVWKP